MRMPMTQVRTVCPSGWPSVRSSAWESADSTSERLTRGSVAFGGSCTLSIRGVPRVRSTFRAHSREVRAGAVAPGEEDVAVACEANDRACPGDEHAGHDLP